MVVARFDPAALAPLAAPDVTATLTLRPPRLAKYGTRGRATVVIRNVGTQAADGWVGGSLNLRAPDGTVAANLTNIEQDLDLPPGGSVTRRVRWRLEQDVPAGSYTFSVTIRSQTFWESDDTNNVVTGPPLRVERYFVDPALEVAAPAATLARGQSLPLDAWIANRGNRTSKQAFHLTASLVSVDRPSSMNARADLPVPRRTLRAGERRPHPVLLAVPDTLMPGAYRLRITLRVLPGYASVVHNDERANDAITFEVTVT